MKSRKYWEKRAEQAAESQYEKTDEYIDAVKREYELAIRSMTKDMNEWFYRFAKNNELSFADGKKLLTTKELKEFKWTLAEFTAVAKGNLDGTWTKELDNVYIKTRVSRLEALMIQLQQQIELLAGNQIQGTTAVLQNAYGESYYRNIFEIHQGLGIGVAFAHVDTAAVAAVVAQPWLGKNFSSRIWEDRDKLAREVRNTVSQGLIRGDGIEQMTRALSARMEVARSNAERVIRTESAHIIQQATYDGYKGSGIVEKYQILATLDKRTSKICQGLDGKVFKMSERETGTTFPPFHPNCRTTTVVYFEADSGLRAARDASGKSITVPSSMTYKEWKEEYGVEIKDIKPKGGKASQSGRQLEFTEYDIID